MLFWLSDPLVVAIFAFLDLQTNNFSPTFRDMHENLETYNIKYSLMFSLTLGQGRYIIILGSAQNITTVELMLKFIKLTISLFIFYYYLSSVFEYSSLAFETNYQLRHQTVIKQN